VNIPGKIIVVDDVEEESKNLINNLRSNGENVYYTEGLLDDNCVRNTRLLITDFYLAADADTSIDMITSIINIITHKTKFFLIVIWSKYVSGYNGDDIIKEIQVKYKHKYSENISAIFLPAYNKNDIEYENLISKINDFIKTHKELGLLYEYERIIENARDEAVSDISNILDVGTIIKTSYDEIGKESISRFIIKIYTRILQRYIQPSALMDESILNIISKNSKKTYEKYKYLHFITSYYFISKLEPIWTGDILYDPYKNLYYIVMTPECDFAQKNVRYIKLIEAFKIEHKDLENKIKIPELKKLVESKLSKKEFIKSILTGNKLKQNYYPLCFIKNKDGENFYHLIMDFQKSTNIFYKTFPKDLKLKRICRIDNTIVHHILQKYSVVCSRIGVMTIPKEVVDEINEKTK